MMPRRDVGEVEGRRDEVGDDVDADGRDREGRARPESRRSC